MANPIPYPLVNGTRHSWASIEAKPNNVLVVGFQEINYNDKLEPTKIYGTAPDPIGRTLGEYLAEGSFTMLLAEFYKFIAILGPGYKQVVFPMTVQYSADGLDTITDEIIGARITNVEAANTRGTDPSLRKCTLDIMKVRWNGFDSLLNPIGGVPA